MCFQAMWMQDGKMSRQLTSVFGKHKVGPGVNTLLDQLGMHLRCDDIFGVGLSYIEGPPRSV